MFVWREVSTGSVEGVMPQPWFSKRSDYGNRDKFRLHELTPISTRSLSLSDCFFPPYSACVDAAFSCGATPGFRHPYRENCCWREYEERRA